MRDRLWPVGGFAALALAGMALAVQASPAQDLLTRARTDIAHGDGIAAEARISDARRKGASDNSVAALLGQAYLLQGEIAKAREWLTGRVFAPADAAGGWHALGLLEQREGNLSQAGRAYDKALALTPRDPVLWVDIARMRYAGGEHMLSIEAIDHALSLDPANARAVEAKGQLVRDQFGPLAALAWFKTGLSTHPDDPGLLGEYASTLADVGRASEALAVSRRLLGADPRNPRGFFIQSVIAARGGDFALARALLNRADDSLAKVPAAMLLDALILLEEGNPRLAVAALERLARMQPANSRVRDLLARALFVAGQHTYLVERMAGPAAAAGGTPYLNALVGRSLEILGDRQAAAPFLDRAIGAAPGFVHPVHAGGDFAWMLASGQAAMAGEQAERERIATPGNFSAQSRAGDAQLAMGKGGDAYARYRLAARVREPESLFLREVEALSQAGQGAQAVALVESWLGRNPQSRSAARLMAGLSAQRKDWKHSRLLLEYLVATGSDDDPRLLADLAFVYLRAGDADAARKAAMRAFGLQPSSPYAAQSLGLILAKEGRARNDAGALLAAARKGLGETPLVIEGLRLLDTHRPAR